MPLRYYVVNTEPCAEAIAQSNIAALKFVVYLPDIVRTCYHRSGKSTRVEWLFPSYLFVQFDRDDQLWRAIGRARGVKCILGADPERPTPVPLGVIESLMERFNSGEFNPPPEPGPLQAGEMGLVESGSFATHVGRCLKSRNGRVRLLLSLFGGASEVEFPAGAVSRFEGAVHA